MASSPVFWSFCLKNKENELFVTKYMSISYKLIYIIPVIFGESLTEVIVFVELLMGIFGDF